MLIETVLGYRRPVMNEKLSGLYQRICAYAPDDGESQFTFSQRLARDNGWDAGFAQRVVEEYKKFMFLAVAAGHPVTPSEQIDQAWHLHLIYTHSYWDDFCGEVLGKPVHHGPTKGGADERAKYHDWYDRTTDSYRRLLNESSPPDIWPAADIRFGDDMHCQRVNNRHNWIIPKPTVKRVMMGLPAIVLLVATLMLVRDFIRIMPYYAPERLDEVNSLHLIEADSNSPAAHNAGTRNIFNGPLRVNPAEHIHAFRASC